MYSFYAVVVCGLNSAVLRAKTILYGYEARRGWGLRNNFDRPGFFSARALNARYTGVLAIHLSPSKRGRCGEDSIPCPRA